jgi:hypothetical protein
MIYYECCEAANGVDDPMPYRIDRVDVHAKYHQIVAWVETLKDADALTEFLNKRID